MITPFRESIKRMHLNLLKGLMFLPLMILNVIMQGQTFIPGGYVSGNWDSAHSPYVIQGDVLVHPDSTLGIGEGSTVLFAGPYMLEVFGRLLVNGTAENPVIFDRENDTISWHGIYFNTTDTSMTDSSVLAHGVISHCYQYSCLTFDQSDRVRVSYFIVQYGSAFRGAGLHCIESDPWLEDIQIRYNHALDGAGIALENSSATLRNCIITQNTADGAGGGMAIFYGGAPYLENCTISQNQSLGSGGGIYMNQADPVLVHCLLLENEGAIGAGNLYSGGGVSVKLGCNATFENCSFVGNTSHREGGGIASFSPNEIINCLFTGNDAALKGGAAYLGSGNLVVSHLHNCTLTNNDSPQGTALATFNHTGVLRNCILWHTSPVNPGSLIHLDASMTLNVLNVRYSDIQGGEAGIELSGSAQYIWSQGNIDLDPAFEPGAWDLSWQSSCIEAGTADTTGLGLPETDLAGNPRIVNARVDMGGYEYQMPVGVESAMTGIQKGVRVYPVPAGDHLWVEVDKAFGDGDIQVVNSAGAALIEEKITSPVKMINTEDLPSGFYLIKISHAEGSLVRKLLIY